MTALTAAAIEMVIVRTKSTTNAPIGRKTQPLANAAAPLLDQRRPARKDTLAVGRACSRPALRPPSARRQIVPDRPPLQATRSPARMSMPRRFAGGVSGHAQRSSYEQDGL